MRVRIVTPTDVVLDEDAVHVTLEDITGSLGIRPGHTPLVSPLVPGIATVRNAHGAERFVALNGGVLIVNADTVNVVTRQATAGTDFEHLEDTALLHFGQEDDDAKENRVAFEKMRLTFVRRVLEIDRAGS